MDKNVLLILKIFLPVFKDIFNNSKIGYPEIQYFC